MRKTISFTSVLAISLIACGGGSGSNVDAKMGSGSNMGSGSACKIASTFSPTFNGSNSEADHYVPGVFGTGSPEEVDFYGNLDAAGDIEVDLFINPGSDFPMFPVVSTSKTVDTSTMETDVGALIFADPDAQNHPQVLYATVGGTVTITSSGSANATFSGSVSNLTFVHADQGSNGLSVDPDHCMSTMSFSFTGTELVGSAGGFDGGPEFVHGAGMYLQHRSL